MQPPRVASPGRFFTRSCVLTGVTTATMHRQAGTPSGTPFVWSEDFANGTLVLDPAFEALSAEKKKGRLARFSYEFACMDLVNLNRRVYPRVIWTEAARLLNTDCGRGRIWGRMDHPDPWDPNARIPTTRDAAVRVISVEGSDGNAKVVFDVLDNPDGHRLMNMREVGGDICISQRGMAEWDEASQSEKTQYGVPPEEDLLIARGLRLITFDVVSQPGFESAGNPNVTESQGNQTMLPKNVAELKTALPDLAQALINEGKGLVDTTKIGNEAVVAATPKIVEDAVKPLNTTIAEKTKVIDSVKVALEALKPAMQLVGIELATVTDAQLQAKVTTLTADKSALESKVADLTTKLNAAEALVKTYKDGEASEAAITPVREKYGKGKFATQILAHVKALKPKDAAEALRFGADKAAEIKATIAAAGGTINDAAFESGGATVTKPGEVSTENRGEPNGSANGGAPATENASSRNVASGISADWNQ